MKSLQVLKYPKLASTNQSLYQLALEGALEGTAVVAAHQTHGKGYAGNQWVVEDGKNLTFSFLVRKKMSVPEGLFLLNQWVVTGVHQVLSKWQTGLKIKWPNDIYFQKKKLGGILIENKIAGNSVQFSVVGIGLNLNQTNFNDLPNATSLRVIKGVDYSVDHVMYALLEHFQANYNALSVFPNKELDEYYHAHLFQKDSVAVYEIDEKKRNGIIRGVDKAGRLMLETDDHTLRLAVKEVKYCL